MRHFALFLLVGFLATVWWLGLVTRAGAAESPVVANIYGEPQLLTGRIYAKQGTPPTVLFDFRRTAICESNSVQVLREYRCPDGTLAAREKVVYRENRLISYESEDLRAREIGRVSRETKPSSGAAGRSDMLRFTFGPVNDKPSTGREGSQPDPLISDMLPSFIDAHWEELRRGSRVKFRFVALSRTETVGFSIVKESEGGNGPTAMLRFRMEPTSWFIAQLVEPIFFEVEREGKHRILRYTGRTTPKVKSGSKWNDLDAITVFDWE